jgi:sugar lactone lactonase YvrE
VSHTKVVSRLRTVGVGLALTGLALVVVFEASTASATPPIYTLSVVAGTGNQGTPTTGSATASDLNNPQGVAVDAAGDVYIADSNNSEVEKVDSTGQLTVVAGTGVSAAPVPGPNAQLSPLGFPDAVAVDGSGNLYIGDVNSSEVLKVDPSGALSVFAGGGGTVPTTTAGAATSADIGDPTGLFVDGAGDVFISSSNYQVYKVDPNGSIILYAGVYNGYNATVPGVATSADIYGPVGMAMDDAGNLYIAVQYNAVIVKVDPAGNLTIVAGTGTFGAATPGPATASDLDYPIAVAIDPSGNLLIADYGNYQVEEVDSGQLSVIAGNGGTAPAVSGPALSSPIYAPYALAVSPVTGAVYVGNDSASQVVKLTPPASAPGAPTGLQATSGSGSAALSFTPPVFTSGLPITGYEDSTDGGTTWHTLTFTGSTTITGTITGLAAGTTYQVEVRAVNSVGSGPGSASISVSQAVASTPIPTSPIAVAGTSSATVSWTAPSPSTGVTGYTVYAHPGLATCSTSSAVATSCVIGGTAGTAYTYTVVAHSAAGDSAASVASNSVTPLSPSVASSAPTSASTTLTTNLGAISEAQPGEALTVIGTGFLPYSTATIVVYSSPVVLATVVTDANGDFSKPVTIPATLEVGSHNLVAFGVDLAGATRTLRLPFAITSLPTTGVDAAPVLWAALILLIVGGSTVLFASRVRRRKHSV